MIFIIILSVVFIQNRGILNKVGKWNVEIDSSIYVYENATSSGEWAIGTERIKRKGTTSVDWENLIFEARDGVRCKRYRVKIDFLHAYIYTVHVNMCIQPNSTFVNSVYILQFSTNIFLLRTPRK